QHEEFGQHVVPLFWLSKDIVSGAPIEVHTAITALATAQTRWYYTASTILGRLHHDERETSPPEISASGRAPPDFAACRTHRLTPRGEAMVSHGAQPISTRCRLRSHPTFTTAARSRPCRLGPARSDRRRRCGRSRLVHPASSRRSRRCRRYP